MMFAGFSNVTCQDDVCRVFRMMFAGFSKLLLSDKTLLGPCKAPKGEKQLRSPWPKVTSALTQ